MAHWSEWAVGLRHTAHNKYLTRSIAEDEGYVFLPAGFGQFGMRRRYASKNDLGPMGVLFEVSLIDPGEVRNGLKTDNVTVRSNYAVFNRVGEVGLDRTWRGWDTLVRLQFDDGQCPLTYTSRFPQLRDTIV